MEFIKASESDIPEIQEMARISWAEPYKAILSPEQITYMLRTMYSTEVLAKQIAGGAYHYYILQEHGRLGFIGVEPHFQPDTTKLHRLYLLPQAIGKGFGKKAMDFVKKLALEAGDHRIILNVNKHNPAQEFYRGQGFSVFQDEVVDIGGGYVMDDHVMESTLDTFAKC